PVRSFTGLRLHFALFPCTTLFRSTSLGFAVGDTAEGDAMGGAGMMPAPPGVSAAHTARSPTAALRAPPGVTSIAGRGRHHAGPSDRKSTRLNSSHVSISYDVFCLK